jgi:hypothetical protein
LRGRLSSVEAEDELVEIVVEVLVTNGSLMGSEHLSLEQGNRPVDSGQQVFPILEATLDLPVMDIAFHLTIGNKPISANCASGFDRRSDKAVKGCPVEIGDSCHANASDAFAILLGSDDNERLAGWQSFR